MVTVGNRSPELLGRRALGVRTLWVDATSAFRDLARWVALNRHTGYGLGVSPEWLRCYEIESAKHVDDH